MTESKSPILSVENQPTAIVVTFVLAVLAVIFGFINYKQIHDVAVFYGKLQVLQAQKAGSSADVANKVTDLEGRITKLESELAAARAAAVPAAPVAAPAVAPAAPVKTAR